MSHFVICQIGDRKFIKRVYNTLEECHAYFAKLLQEIQAKPESYRVLHHSNTELMIEEVDEQGQLSQRKYTTVTGEIEEVLHTIEEYSDDHADSPV